MPNAVSVTTTTDEAKTNWTGWTLKFLRAHVESGVWVLNAYEFNGSSGVNHQLDFHVGFLSANDVCTPVDYADEAEVRQVFREVPLYRTASGAPIFSRPCLQRPQQTLPTSFKLTPRY